MEIKLLNSKQYKKETGLSRTTLYRRIKTDKISVLKTSPKKLWFLPLNFTLTKNQS